MQKVLAGKGKIQEAEFFIEQPCLCASHMQPTAPSVPWSQGPYARVSADEPPFIKHETLQGEVQ